MADGGARVGLIMGSDSDWPVMEAAAHALAEFDIPFEVGVVSAHRTPDRMLDYARTAADRGIEVIIAGAGGAAHLPGMVASATAAAGDRRSGAAGQARRPRFAAVDRADARGCSGGDGVDRRGPQCRAAGGAHPRRRRCPAAQAGGGVPGAARGVRAGEGRRPAGPGARGPTVKLLASSKEFLMAGNPDFDVFKLPEEHDELRAVLRDLCEKEIEPHAADVDEKPRFPDEALKALNESGFSAVHVPEEYGGQGADSVATCIVIEEVARVCASSSLIPAVNKLGTMGLILSGSDELKKQVLPVDRVRRGDGVVCAVRARSRAATPRRCAPARARTATRGSSTAPRCWITNGGKSTWYTVMASSDPDKGANGISAFMVHKDDEGFTVGPKERKLGIKGSPTTELYFENCRIPGDRIIGEPGTGFKTALRTLDHTRPTIGAQAVGIAQGALDAAIAYTKDRKQFGKSISDFQGVQFMLADMAMKVEAARLMVYTAAARAERGEPALGFISSASKCFASDVAMEVTTDAVQLFGGAGYTQDFPVERMMRDAKITQIYEGTNQIQRVVMGRALLS